MNTRKITKTTTLAILAIAAVGIVVSSAAITKPALAKSNDNNHNNSVSKSDIRDVGKFLQCIASHGGNDISKKQAQRCVDNHLG
jgi:hypothetical protein